MKEDEGNSRDLELYGDPKHFSDLNFFFIPPIVEVEVALFDTEDQVLLIFVQR